jgi:hypothetical protein
VGKELRQLIFRMVADNPTWGAPRIHGELKMLGFDISERSVLHWMRKAPRNPKPSVITLKPAIRYHFKTGQRNRPKT